MITTLDFKFELMIDEEGKRFKRKLEKEEIWNLINSKYSDDEAEEKLFKLEKAGLSLLEIFDFAIKEKI